MPKFAIASLLSSIAPCISSIRPGFLEFSEDASKKQRYFVSGGIIEVMNNMVSVLVDSAIEGDKVVKEDITALISEVDDKLSSGDIINKDDLGLRKNDLEEALKQA